VKLRVLAQADADAIEAANWYEDQKAGLGLRFLEAVRDTFRAIEKHPRRFPKLEIKRLPRELTQGRSIRRALIRRFPYLVVYEVLEDEVLIVAVSHGRRRQSYWYRRVTKPPE
jgi:plasmid stabilization system protein ParE